MCGICGAVALRSAPLAPGVESRVGAMLGALAHRGPDSSGLHATPAAVLGATRLAIRGIADGRQPLVDPASGVAAVCNGELDNHGELRRWLAERGRPVTQATDVAIIPGLYLELGEAFAERLVGAFAIALWDPCRRLLLLLRDRAGEKPLFFRYADGEAHFATELAALTAFAVPGGIDRDALAHYLRFGCFAVPGAPLSGVEKVGPGERVAIDAAGVRRERYWRWRGFEPAVRRGAAGPSEPCASEAPTRGKKSSASRAPGVESPEPAGQRPAPTLDDLDRTFRQAVLRQTDVEVPCGVFLSGGVDSSLVAAVARAVRPELRLASFSLRFAESSYDEGEVAAKVADHLGLSRAEVWVRPGDFAACLEELVRLAGEPLADPAWAAAALLARRAAADVGQVLVGEGGDELFGGYPTYTGVWLSERYCRLPAPLRHGLARLIRALPPSDRKVTLSFLLKRFVDGADTEGLARHLLWTSNIAPELLARLGAGPRAGGAPDVSGLGGRSDPAGLSGWPAAAVPPPGELLDRVQQHDLENTLAEGLLTKADRASMHFALELRAPFLDRDVMELAAALPPRERVRGLATKVFLKRYARRYLPRWVVYRRKRGLSVPLASWLRGPLGGWARERLGGGLLAGAGLDERAALALFEEHRRRDRDHARALWTLVVLAEWLAWARSRGVLAPAAEAADGTIAVSTAASATALPAAARAVLPATPAAGVAVPAAAAVRVR